MNTDPSIQIIIYSRKLMNRFARESVMVHKRFRSADRKRVAEGIVLVFRDQQLARVQQCGDVAVAVAVVERS